MKKSIFFALVLLLGTGAVTMSAQPPGGPGRGVPPQAQPLQDRMEALQLTDAQKAKMKEIREKYRPKFQAMRQEQTQDREAMRKQMEEMRKELRAVLDPAQQAKWDAMPQRPAGPPPGSRNAPRNFPRPGAGKMAPRAPQRLQRPPAPQPPSELQKAIQAYSQKEILPVLQKERKALEAILSPEDREQLASLRTQAKARMAVRPARPPIRPGMGKNRPPTPQQEALAKLEKRYGKDIQKIFARLEPQMDKWNQDLKAIRQKFAPQGPPRPAAPRGPAAYRWLEPKRFLMMPPNK